MIASDRSLAFRRRLLLGFWLLAVLGLLVRAFELQVLQGAEWRAEAVRQHRMQSEVAAPRGSILDRGEIPLAVSHETFRVGVAPHELSDREAAARLLAESLGVSTAEGERIAFSDQRWVAVSGRYPRAAREALSGVRGVYVERELRRFRPHGDMATGVLGPVVDGEGIGGVELRFEDHLRGVSGSEVTARSSDGVSIPGETWLLEPPRPGGDVVLTLDATLQEIADEALREAVDSTSARGGDLMVTDPRTGDVLAMASIRNGRPSHGGSINTPYEPGSTLKPFTVAALLRERRVALSDSVDTRDGYWETHGRRITDVVPVGVVTLAEALAMSSNVGIARMAEALSPEEQYEALRDFGFGVPTGIELPGEVGGTLRRPSQWSRQSPASLAIGYEVAVTSMQMAMAYGALANGGVLMEPRLVKQLRDERGQTVRSFEPRAVRRVMSEDVAREITGALVGAVEVGTGTEAGLASFAVAGKSGTSRAYSVSSGYESGAYFASFAAFFPAEAPQLVVFVKLERPQGEYYGGAAAAPVTRATLEAILAARRSPLDRRALAALGARLRGASAASEPVRGPTLRFASTEGAGESVALPEPEPAPAGKAVVPDVSGLAPRAAARRLHAIGLSVSWDPSGTAAGTRPPAGAPVQPGDTVRIMGISAGVDPPESRTEERR